MNNLGQNDGAMDRLRVLLINPPIFDFTAYDFWSRPYGMFRVGGRLRNACELSFFDFLVLERRDPWGRGRFREEIVPKPAHFRDIPRRYRRFGRPRREFREFLTRHRLDAALIQTGMTYWYQGPKEAIEDLRELQPGAKIVLGGIYASLCPAHAHSLGADLVVEGADLEPLWRMLAVAPGDGLPYWDAAPGPVGVIKLTEGCPFRCTYCSVPVLSPQFRTRPLEECLMELRQLARLGVRQVAFYDDALLFQPNEGLIPFLQSVQREEIPVSFHTPNALNARFLGKDLARLMVRCGVRNFFLGLESDSPEWQEKTGGKVQSQEFSDAVTSLKEAGAQSINAYIIVGHPDTDVHRIESAMRFAHQMGSRIVLSEFAPIPGTPDGERCREWADLDEPLSHNKTAFTIRRLGKEPVNRLKNLCRSLNATGKLGSA
jgi:molybdenum cofactor biosynthesis enzyme MoaA